MTDEATPLFALSRTDDPETSRVSAGEKDNLSRLRQMVLDEFERVGRRGMTDAVLESLERSRREKQTSLRKRRQDLVQLGIVVDSGRREVPYGATKSRIVWVLTKFVPRHELALRNPKPPSKAKKRELLWQECREFIAATEITAAETVYQSDRVQMGATEFIEKICAIVGYHKGEK